ncbi:hypothetical protein T310_7029, partial [Rasamsonia emersonii CBS 393.64]
MPARCSPSGPAPLASITHDPSPVPPRRIDYYAPRSIPGRHRTSLVNSSHGTVKAGVSGVAGAPARGRALRPGPAEARTATAAGWGCCSGLPWQRIVNATESLAASHETFAQKMEEDVERPLREYATKNKDLQSMPSIQNDLAALSKTLEAAQRKVDKAKEKGHKGADKVAAAVSALEEASQQWESRAPFVFEQLQAIDESRLNHLRDVLTQLQTHEVDQIERNRQTAESCLNALLNVQTADEIKTWATKINGGREPVPRRQESGTVNPSDLPPPPRLQDDAASQHSNRSGRSRVPPPAPEPRHTPLGGLRRLGTVMNRRKSIVQAPGGAFPLSEKKNRSPFPFRRSDSSREAHTQLPSTPPGRDTPSTGFDSITTPPDTRHTG